MPWPRVELGWTLALALAGLAVAIFLASLHARAHAGGSSFCALSASLNCDRVALSTYSVLLGLPVAVWGALGYATIAGLATYGLAHPPTRTSWPAGLLLLLSAAAAAASLALAVVSKFAIGSWCLLCAVSWAISLGLFATAWRTCRYQGRWRAILDDLARLRTGGWRTAGGAALLLAGVGLALLVYPRYWDGRTAQRHTGSHDASPSPGGRRLSIEEQIARFEAANDAQRSGPILVYEYSDYECPSCARMHEETRGLAGREGITITRRHFPLDSSCNSAVSRPIHPDSCALARAGICAEAQGRLGEMDDALFANQQKHASIEAMASRVGLDLERFRSCLVSPETGRRLAADVAAGIRDGVQATPSYVLDGQVFAGRLPPRLARLAHATQPLN